jgi:DNA-binding HxlR family transcriptional regulator
MTRDSADASDPDFGDGGRVVEGHPRWGTVEGGFLVSVARETSTGTRTALVRRSDPRDARRLSQSDRSLVEHIEEVLGLLQGKWKVHLIFLMARGVHRHCRLLERLPGASKKVTTDTLRALERDGLVSRRLFAEVPLRVEYSLTPLGWAITEPLMALAEWHTEYGSEVREARLRHGLGTSGARERPGESAAAARRRGRRLGVAGRR